MAHVPSKSGTRTTSILSSVSSGKRSRRAAAEGERAGEERSGGFEGERGLSALACAFPFSSSDWDPISGPNGCFRRFC